MRISLLAAAAVFAAALGFGACATEDTATYHNQLTGNACIPDETFVPMADTGHKHPGCDNQHCCIDTDAGCHNGHHGGSGSGSGSGSSDVDSGVLNPP